MSRREATAFNSEQTIARARAVPAEHAVAPGLCANRVEPRAVAHYSAMARGTAEDPPSAAKCRQFGEIIRSDREPA